MQIKHQALAQHIQRKSYPLYVLIGQDNYLIEDSLNIIKSSLKSSRDCDEKVISLQSAEDWNAITDEANSYSLFSETVLLNTIYDKKTLDATGKKVLSEYLKAVNSRCCIILRAPNIPAKQLMWLAHHEEVLLVVAYPLNADAMKSWISGQFKKNQLNAQPQITDLIYQYTQGNMLACAQVIEKIALSNPPQSQINTQQAMEHLSDQCDHSLFELANACLLNQPDKAIQILRQAVNNKTEPTLALWMLTQEARTLLQLSYLIQQNVDIKTASSQLKIWPQRLNLYQASVRRLNSAVLQEILLYCQIVDQQIKSSLNGQMWHALEKIALSLCLGSYLGEPCAD
ncbi:DNA polymerase III subunit delta [Legionella shakespearei]|uniref:DNA polymerase III subunit delta n=1 Tax=Legionella shakespearei DSM 23087 TaxID=1122169 RepID=A0A0W0YQR5_9GAMM|nr:DNA polymerase III subunit delta [Legionella shakespearei]KTD59213.1 DNA polymerase III, delta subunit [Legionella shakespearei DSM 23087]